MRSSARRLRSGYGQRLSRSTVDGLAAKNGKLELWDVVARWRIIFDSVPAKGNRILMDGMPLYLELADGS